jgi:uncharacterized membrane protein (DUF2068 family)
MAEKLWVAYGLWRVRRWAKGSAIVSGGIFLPVELYELVHRATVVKEVVLVVNAAIAAYLISIFAGTDGASASCCEPLPRPVLRASSTARWNHCT